MRNRPQNGSPPFMPRLDSNTSLWIDASAGVQKLRMIGAVGRNLRSKSKNYKNAPNSGIIEETGVF